MKAIREFNFPPGRIIARKYEVRTMIGRGWEGEVYKVHERHTGIECAAKIFFPQRNVKNKVSDYYARKLHFLRECPAVIAYHHQERILYQGTYVTALISEYVEGELLSEYLSKVPGRRLTAFQGIHLLHALCTAIEPIHHLGEYHGDLHSDNIIIRRVGLSYELKLLDFFHWGWTRKANMKDDICNLVRIFYDVLGGQKRYAKHPPEVKAICCGLKRTGILKRFPRVSDLRLHLETQSWS